MSSRAINTIFGSVFALAVIILYVPVLTVAVYALFRVNGRTLDLSAPTLEYFGRLIVNDSVLDALANSAIAAFFSTVASLAAATLYAAFLRDKPATTRAIFETLIFAPFFLPPIIVGLSLLLASSESGFPRGMATVVLGHTLFSLAIVYKVIGVRLDNLPRSLEEASSDLGATKWQTIRFVIFPHLLSAFVAAGLLSVLLSFDETLITALVSGDATTLPLRLWAMMRVGFSPAINALVVIVVGICLVLAMGLFFAISSGARRT
jgi:ABC-type spermidine/putrescine transport system permease subunit II